VYELLIRADKRKAAAAAVDAVGAGRGASVAVLDLDPVGTPAESVSESGVD
jgi:hypothetical protein